MGRPKGSKNKPKLVATDERSLSYQRAEAITPIEYSGLQGAFDHFNAALFEGSLPDVFITYQRKAHSAGYRSPDRFSGRTSQFAKHELVLNPDGFIGQSDKDLSDARARDGPREAARLRPAVSARLP